MDITVLVFILKWGLILYIIYDIFRMFILPHITPYRIAAFFTSYNIKLSAELYPYIEANPNYEIWTTFGRQIYHTPGIIWRKSGGCPPVMMIRNSRNIHLYYFDARNHIIEKILMDIRNTNA